MRTSHRTTRTARPFNALAVIILLCAAALAQSPAGEVKVVGVITYEYNVQ